MNVELIHAVYHPVEAAAIRIALRLPPQPGDSDLDLWNRKGNLPEGVVHLQESRFLDPQDQVFAASNALARIVLSPVASELPNYFYSRERVTQSTRGKPALRKAGVRCMPIRLFGINWATSWLGICWPEVYYIGWLPGFDRWILCGSYDTPEVVGCCDRMIENFCHNDDPVGTASEWLVRYWAGERDRYDQPRWEEVLCHGRISRADAEALADRVWPVESGEDELEIDENEAG
jgi:hypothetical protein